MKTFIVSGIAAAALAASSLAAPSFAQTQTNQQQNQPGSGGVSKPGVQGLPGSKSGPTTGPAAGPKAQAAPSMQRAAKPETESGSDEKGEMTKNQDQSKVPGKPGNKSGPTQTKE
jgi:hypothetical protein